MRRKTKRLDALATDDRAREIAEALRLPAGVRLDAETGDLLMEIDERCAGEVEIDGRALPGGRRVLLGGESLRHGKRRVVLTRPSPRGSAGGSSCNEAGRGRAPGDGGDESVGTRTLGLVALAHRLVDGFTSGPCLVVLEGDAAGRRWPLVEGTQIVGRGPDADIVLLDETVSRNHARVTVEGVSVAISDVGSRHGVRVKGRLGRRSHKLSLDSEVVLGEARLRLLAPPLVHAPPKAIEEGEPKTGSRSAGAILERLTLALAVSLPFLGGALSTLAFMR